MGKQIVDDIKRHTTNEIAALKNDNKGISNKMIHNTAIFISGGRGGAKEEREEK